MDWQKERRKSDAERLEKSDGDLCMLCHAYGADKRSLYISCLYAMNEVVPEMIDLTDTDRKQHGYYLRICKSCRGSLLGHIADWAEERRDRRSMPKDHDGDELYPGDDDEDEVFYVRIHGVAVPMTPEQFKVWKAERE